jgi:soluble lytic murein transglycosylase
MVQRLILTGLLLCGLSHLLGGPSVGDFFEAPKLHSVGAAPPEQVSAQSRPLDQPIDLAEREVLDFLRGTHTGMSQADEENVARVVVREARRYGLDPALVLAVIQVESGGYYLAVSHVGAIGLMQLLPTTAEELAGRLDLDWRGPDSLFDPVINVKLGIAYIKHLADRYADVSTALAAYNWGPTRIDRRIRIGSGVPSIYSKRVMKAFKVVASRRPTPPPARG